MLGLPIALARNEEAKGRWGQYVTVETRIGVVRKMNSAQVASRMPVDLRGSVVHVDKESGWFILQSRTAGIRVVDYLSETELKPGDRVDVSGYVAEGGESCRWRPTRPCPRPSTMAVPSR